MLYHDILTLHLGLPTQSLRGLPFEQSTGANTNTQSAGRFGAGNMGTMALIRNIKRRMLI